MKHKIDQVRLFRCGGIPKRALQKKLQRYCLLDSQSIRFQTSIIAIPKLSQWIPKSRKQVPPPPKKKREKLWPKIFSQKNGPIQWMEGGGGRST